MAKVQGKKPITAKSKVAMEKSKDSKLSKEKSKKLPLEKPKGKTYEKPKTPFEKPKITPPKKTIPPAKEKALKKTDLKMKIQQTPEKKPLTKQIPKATTPEKPSSPKALEEKAPPLQRFQPLALERAKEQKPTDTPTGHKPVLTAEGWRRQFILQEAERSAKAKKKQ